MSTRRYSGGAPMHIVYRKKRRRPSTVTLAGPVTTTKADGTTTTEPPLTRAQAQAIVDEGRTR